MRTFFTNELSRPVTKRFVFQNFLTELTAGSVKTGQDRTRIVKITTLISYVQFLVSMEKDIFQSKYEYSYGCNVTDNTIRLRTVLK